jgi:sugar lactone lactonase YvrE
MLFASHAAVTAATVYDVTTFAGTAPGSADGQGSAARFYGPGGLTIDADSGAIYVADTGNQLIRRVAADGSVSTVLGVPRANALGAAAGSTDLLAYPQAVALGGGGSLFVAQGYDIYQIAPNGTATKVVSSGGLVADLALAADGTLYWADSSRHQIWKRSPGGAVSRVAGSPLGASGSMDGAGDAARFNSPWRLALGANGAIYVADRFNYTIRKIDAAGAVTTLAGAAGQSGSADGAGGAARFTSPSGIDVDAAGNVFVADFVVVRKITAGGAVSTLAGSAGALGSSDGAGAAARFSGIQDLVIDAAGVIYVTDNNTVRKISPAGAVTTLAGVAGEGSVNGALGAARFIAPADVVVAANGTMYVADADDHTIRKIATDGTVSTFAGASQSPGSANGAGSAARFQEPTGLAIDGAGNLYVADMRNHTIRKITPAGNVSTFAGTAGAAGATNGAGTAAKFSTPTGVAVDTAGNVYVADKGNRLVRKITPDGTVSTLAGQAGVVGDLVDGQGSAARFLAPADVAVDVQGNIWVADYEAVRKITPAGLVDTVAGSWKGSPSGGSADGNGSSAKFAELTGIATAPTGELYVVDNGNDTIRRVTTGGTVTTIAGRAKEYGAIDGRGASARFNLPQALTVNAAGQIFVADRWNAAVRKITSGTLPVFDVQPQSAVVAAGGNTTLVTRVTAAGAAYQWQANGATVSGGTAASLAVNDIQPANAGLYSAVATAGGTSAQSDPAIVGVSSSAKVIGSGHELTPVDIVHPNGNVFDQVLIEGAAESITADADQVTRTSFIDLDDDIVQVEFSGPGTLTLVLDGASGPARPANYNQAVDYMKGRAGIVITGATEQTNVSVFTVGRATAFDPTGAYNILQAPGASNDPAKNGSALFAGHANTRYDGIADIAFIAIVSSNGQFGGVRTANARYSASKGMTGLYAPGVSFQGPVFIGDICAFGDATPAIVAGATIDARITGGDLAQDNGRAVQVSGLTKLNFAEGSDSAGNIFAAKQNRGVLEKDGADVTSTIVVNP